MLGDLAIDAVASALQPIGPGKHGATARLLINVAASPSTARSRPRRSAGRVRFAELLDQFRRADARVSEAPVARGARCAIAATDRTAPQELSGAPGAFHVTVYGVAGGWIDTAATCAGLNLSVLRRFAVSTTASR